MHDSLRRGIFKISKDLFNTEHDRHAAFEAFPTFSSCMYAMEACGNSAKYVALHACLDLSWFYLLENSALARVASLRFLVDGPINSLSLLLEYSCQEQSVPATRSFVLGEWSLSTPILLYYPTAYLRPIHPPF